MNKQCPNCKEYKLITSASQLVIVGMSITFIGGIFLILFLPFGLILGSLGLFVLVMGIVSYFIPDIRNSYHCNKCHWNGKLEDK